MNTNRSAGLTCQEVCTHLDGYLDRELQTELQEEVSAHLSACAECRQEQSHRTAFRARFQAALSGVSVPLEVAQRIRQSIRATPPPSRWSHWGRSLAAVAATVTIWVGGVIAYQLGHLRMTAASQESYVASISRQVAGIMRVGLQDHVHCAVFRKFPKTPPTVEQMAADLGPQYKDLVQVVQKQVPSGYRIMLAHQCRYHGRQFIHLAATDGSRLMSLVVTRRGGVESFSRDQVLPALSSAGIPIYRTGVQRFHIAGFETQQHLVYVISDMGASQSDQIMMAIAPAVRTLLSQIES